MVPAAERLLNESKQFDPKLLEIKNWKLQDLIIDKNKAVFQLNFTYPYEISQEKERDIVQIEFLTNDSYRYLNEGSRKLISNCPK